MDVENTSGQGPASRVPPEIRRWNWGAFLLNWIWGIGNNTLAALLVMVPFVGLIWIFVLGAKGSEWAWRNKRWESVEQFHATQRQWAKWGAIVWGASLAVFALIFVLVFGLLKDSEAYKMAQARLAADARIVEIVGQPMSTGIPMGSIQVSGPDGSAQLSFSVEGPRGKGTAYVAARKSLGQWKIEGLAFQEDDTQRRIELVPDTHGADVESAT
ncbi:cytochrome c oxidase assembly factor Coa1 family protein [Roseateles sp. BYS78W]|uniref:Cytochrome c oxidase assembly factor Coa1 family protein n=1 Tax=Pelomonas candidula TaxID=3299025 RepID=A0ABW7H6W3_9BURK